MDLLYKAAHSDGDVDPNEFTDILRPVSYAWNTRFRFCVNALAVQGTEGFNKIIRKNQ